MLYIKHKDEGCGVLVHASSLPNKFKQTTLDEVQLKNSKGYISQLQNAINEIMKIDATNYVAKRDFSDIQPGKDSVNLMRQRNATYDRLDAKLQNDLRIKIENICKKNNLKENDWKAASNAVMGAGISAPNIAIEYLNSRIIERQGAINDLEFNIKSQNMDRDFDNKKKANEQAQNKWASEADQWFEEKKKQYGIRNRR